MKVFINQIPFEGLMLEEELSQQELDLDTETVKFCSPVRIKAKVSRITNAVTAVVSLRAKISVLCCRCLRQFDEQFDKNLELNYPAGKGEVFIDFNPDIREEIILDYPIKYLCSPGCKGLCSRCGKNLNEGGCNCGST